MADQVARQDANQFPALIAHSGTAPTAETRKVVVDDFGRLMGNSQITDPISAFGDLRSVELSPVFQGSFEYTVNNTLLYTNTNTNSGTVTQASAMAVVSSGTTASSTSMLQSRQLARYRSGFGGLIRFTALFSTPVANTEQFVGILDEAGSTSSFKNGFAIGYSGTTFGFHRFVNDSLVTVPQSSWDDPLDGTGESGMVIDKTKLNVFGINFQYLGAGKIQLYIEDQKTGLFTKVHEILYANLNTTPSVFNPNFRFTIFSNNKLTTSNIVVKSASYGYFIEGKTTFIELHQPHQSTGVIQKTTVTTEIPIVTIRNKAQYASKTNFIEVFAENMTGSIEASSTNNLGSMRLVKNATIGGTTSFTDINTANSVIDYDTAGTSITNGRTIINISLAGKNDKAIFDVTSHKVILLPGETLTIAGKSANSATMEAAITWKELF